MSKTEADQLQKIAETVGSIMRVDVDDMKGKGSKQPVADARKVFCVVARLFGFRNKEIAAYLHYLDHTGVSRCQEAFSHLISTHEPVRQGFRETMNVLLT